MKKLTLIIITLLLASACETTIHPQLDDAERILVIDAWVNQKMERQEIRIMRSQPYFDNSVPENLSGASVIIEDLDDGTVYDFEEDSDAYYWQPVSAPFGVVGHHYKLTVTVEGESFEAFSTLGRVPPVDSIMFSYNEENLLIKQPFYTAEFMAREPEGVGDTYWVKGWKNGVFLGKPGELNMTYDAGFTPGQSIDGQQFIIPIRKEFVSPLDENPDKEGEMLPPYLPGDSLYVEIHSIDPAAFDFLFGVYFQITRPGGVAELFSMPLANATTNLKSTNENSTTNVAGFFNVSAVSGCGQKLTDKIAQEAKLNAQ